MAKCVKTFIFLAGLGAVLGGLAGLGLSFTTLSPLVMGGIIGSILSVLPAVCLIGKSAFMSFESLRGKDTGEEQEEATSWAMYFETLTALAMHSRYLSR